MYKGKLYISSDHGGYQLKKRLVRYIENELNLKIEDLGPHEYEETDDYPDYAIPLAEKVAKKKARGITICSSGIGVCIAANKIKGVRAGIGYSIEVAESMVHHDDTNVLCLGAKGVSEEHAMAIVKKWLESEFSGKKRYVRRLEKVEEFEKD